MRILLTALFLIAASTPSALAADYPSRPIRLIVPFTAGSAADLLARMIGVKLTESWGQQTVVDDRPSAGGTVAGGIVATAAPDGHTLMVTSSAFAGSAALYDKLQYDPVKDFSGITLIAVTPTLLVVGPNLGVKSVKELIALAREKPAVLTYGSAGIGSGTHFAAELFNLTAGIRTIVDDGLLSPAFGQLHPDHAREQIGRTARRERHDQPDGP